MLLHGGIQFLREVIGYIGHAWLLLIAPTQAALVFASFLIILLFSIFAVSLCHLQVSTRGRENVNYLLRDLRKNNGKKTPFFFKTPFLKLEFITFHLTPSALFIHPVFFKAVIYSKLKFTNVFALIFSQ